MSHKQPASFAVRAEPGRAGPSRASTLEKGGGMGLAFCAQGAASFRFSAASAPNDARTAAQSTNCCTTIQWWGGDGPGGMIVFLIFHRASDAECEVINQSWPDGAWKPCGPAGC